jgi:hypothetical protein
MKPLVLPYKLWKPVSAGYINKKDEHIDAYFLDMPFQFVQDFPSTYSGRRAVEMYYSVETNNATAYYIQI